MSKPNFKYVENRAIFNRFQWHDLVQQALGANRAEEGWQIAGRALLVFPDDPALLELRASASLEQHQPDRAAAELARASMLVPASRSVWQKIAIAAHLTFKSETAVRAAKRCLVLEPRNHNAGTNLFEFFRRLGDLKAMVRQGALNEMRHPEDDFARFQYGMGLLSLERWREGWPRYDCRLELKTSKPDPRRFADLPFWDGQAGSARRLLIWTDQNVGDEMQFARLLPKVQGRVETVTVECDERLVPLFQRSFPAIRAVARSDDGAIARQAGPFDAQLPQGHLGGVFLNRTEVFESLPTMWLAGDAEKTARLRARYQRISQGKPVIGVAWRSSNKNFQGKNIPLPLWAPILKMQEAFFLSVQYGDVTADFAQLQRATGLRLARDPEIDPMKDLDGFAAQLQALDLVISISNSTIHQACGLGREVWGLVHVRPDWRWGVAGARTPWFPTLKIYRQIERNDWAPVIAEVKEDLQQWLAHLNNA